MTDRLRKDGPWYILCAEKVVYVDDFTQEQVALLIELLKDEFPGPFEAITESELKADPQKYIRLNRDWNDIIPYLGEFDFGIYEFQFPEEWKPLIHINDFAERSANTIKEMGEEQNNEGALSWGPVRKVGWIGEGDPSWTDEMNLYRYYGQHWVLVTERFYDVVEIPPQKDFTKLNDQEAVKWLIINGFPPPADVAHLIQELGTQQETKSPDKSESIAGCDVQHEEHGSSGNISDHAVIAANIQKGEIRVDGTDYEVDAHHCQIIKSLVDAEGLNVTGPKMNDLPGCRGKKISREIKNLENQIPALKKYLKHDGNKGYRIVQKPVP